MENTPIWIVVHTYLYGEEEYIDYAFSSEGAAIEYMIQEQKKISNEGNFYTAYESTLDPEIR